MESALKNRQKHFVIDGEAVILGVDGVPDFNSLRSRRHDEEVQFYAFDIMALDGEDSAGAAVEPAQDEFCAPPGPPTGRHIRLEQGEIGPDLFRAACNMGLEGLASKRRDRAYRSGRSPDWVKVKNRKHPAMGRVMESFG